MIWLPFIQHLTEKISWLLQAIFGLSMNFGAKTCDNKWRNFISKGLTKSLSLHLSFSRVICNSIFTLKAFFEPRSLLASLVSYKFFTIVEIGLILVLPKLGYNLSRILVIFGIWKTRLLYQRLDWRDLKYSDTSKKYNMLHHHQKPL